MMDAELKREIDAAEQGPKKLAAAVSGLPDKVLRYKPSPEKWSILEIVAHLADVEIIYSYRMRQMIAEKGAMIAPINQDAWASSLGYMDATPAELVAQFGINRHHNIRLLRRLSAADLSKSAYHPELKTDVTLADQVKRFAAHDANHLEQIERLKQQAR